MFDKLKRAFSSIGIKNIGQKEVSEKDIDNNLFDLQLALLESDVAQEVIDNLSAKLKKELVGLRLEKGQQTIESIIRSKLYSAIAEMFVKAGKIDLIQKIKIKKESRSGPFVIVFLGINGTGKTTTVAKMAHLLRKNGISVVLAAGDTHRAGAIEQLTQHAERLSLKIISQRYGADPSAVSRDAVDYGRKHYIDAVLIDTAGRMQTSKNLMDEIGKIVRVVKPDMKLFIGDSLAGNDTINQAREFFQYTTFDGAILTKTDADAKGGAAISIAYITSKPIVYFGVGQGYDDIVPFDPDKFLESIFGGAPIINIENITFNTPKVSETEVQKPTTISTTGELGSYVTATTTTTTTKEEPKSTTTPISSLPAIPKASNSPESVPIIAPKIEKKQENFEKSLEEEHPQPTLTNAIHTVIKNQSAVIEKKEERQKKGRFSGLFSRKNKEKSNGKKEEEEEEEEGEVGTKLPKYTKEEKQTETDSKESKKKWKEEEHQEKDDVVYLSDEDIEDLLK